MRHSLNSEDRGMFKLTNDSNRPQNISLPKSSLGRELEKESVKFGRPEHFFSGRIFKCMNKKMLVNRSIEFFIASSYFKIPKGY